MTAAPARRPPPIRDAEHEDLPALAALERACFGSDAWSPDHLADELVEPTALVLVAQYRGLRATGFAALRCVAGEGELLRIAVAPEAQGQGIGTRLLEAGLRRLRLRGADLCHLEVRPSNHAAVALYENHGFHRVGRRRGYYPGGEDALLYARPLTRPERRRGV